MKLKIFLKRYRCIFALIGFCLLGCFGSAILKQLAIAWSNNLFQHVLFLLAEVVVYGLTGMMMTFSIPCNFGHIKVHKKRMATIIIILSLVSLLHVILILMPTMALNFLYRCNELVYLAQIMLGVLSGFIILKRWSFPKEQIICDE